MGLLGQRPPDRRRLHHPHPVELAAAAQHLVEAGELVGRCDDVRGRHDRGPEAIVVGGLDHLVERRAERAADDLRDRRQERRPGDVVVADRAEVGLGDAVVAPAEPERVEDLLGEDLADRLAGDPVDDLAEDEAARDGVVGEHLAGLVVRLRVADRLDEELAVGDPVEVEGLLRHPGDPGAVGEHVADRDVVLSVARVTGDVVADPVLDRERAPLLEQVDDGGGHRLRRRVDAERRLRASRAPRARPRGRRDRCRGRGRPRGRGRGGRGGARRAGAPGGRRSGRGPSPPPRSGRRARR